MPSGRKSFGLFSDRLNNLSPADASQAAAEATPEATSGSPVKAANVLQKAKTTSPSKPSGAGLWTTTSVKGALLSNPTADDIVAAISRLREHLVGKFGSSEAAFKALDTNGNGLLSVGEIRDACGRLRIPLNDITKIKDFNKCIIALVGRTDGELDYNLLMVQEIDPKQLHMDMANSPFKPVKKCASPTKEAAKPAEVDVYEAITRLRKYLVKRFETPQQAFAKLDTNGNGLLSIGEIKEAFKRLHIDLAVETGFQDLRKLFKALDIDLSGELDFWELMTADSKEELAKFQAAKAEEAARKSQQKADRLAREKEEAAAAAAEAARLAALNAREAVDDSDQEDYVRFRNFLLAEFGDAKAAMRVLDDNGNGLLSLRELKDSLKNLRLNVEEKIQGFDLKAMFEKLDVDGSGELSRYELFVEDPHEAREKLRAERKEMLLEHKHEVMDEEPPSLEASTELVEPLSPVSPKLDMIELFRNYLIEEFGSKEAAFEMLDADGSQLLSYGELRVSLGRLGLSLKKACGEKADLCKLFKRLDIDGNGELSFYQLMEAPPRKKGDKKKAKEASRDAEPEVEIEVDTLRVLREEEESEWIVKVHKFARSKKETQLDIRWGHVGRDGAHRLAKALVAANKPRKVKLMQLEGNYITTEGLRPLASAMEKFCKLEKLNLSWNALDNAAAERLGATIAAISTLTELDVQHNHIGDAGAERIARAVGKAKSLKLLNMESNLIGLFGISELRYACGGSKIKVKLRGNMEESTAGCNVKRASLMASATSEVNKSATLAMLESALQDHDPHGNKHIKAILKVPGEYKHNTLCWNSNPNWRIPKNDKTAFLLNQARKAAQDFAKEDGEPGDELLQDSLVSTTTASLLTTTPTPSEGLPSPGRISSDGHSRHRSGTPNCDHQSGSKPGRLMAWADNDSRATTKTVRRDLGISVDFKKSTLPAGDFWPPAVELQKQLTRATLIAEGKLKLERPRSQGSIRDKQRYPSRGAANGDVPKLQSSLSGGFI